MMMMESSRHLGVVMHLDTAAPSAGTSFYFLDQNHF